MNNKKGLVAVLVVLVVALGVVAGVLLALNMGELGGKPDVVSSSRSGGQTSAPPQGSSRPDSSQPAAGIYQAMPLPEEMRGMWLSFLEWETVDFQNKEAARDALSTMLDNCAQMGLNTVFVAVRPFGDALYQSAVYPWSHTLGAAQGQDPGYDPLEMMVELAHQRGLRIEAWINPYRVTNPTNGPDALSDDNPAVQHPELVRDVDGSVWYDPGLPAVRQLVVDGVAEIVREYQVDGVHFDDYFYPEFTAAQREEGMDTAFDAETYSQHNPNGLPLAQWRRENVNTLVREVYAAVKAANPSVSFGISPQGNNDNNYQVQYSDVPLWMANTGYVDYVMPQLYWGFAYRTQSGRDSYAFENVSAQWAGYPRTGGVRLYAGLGAYRIGAGDGGSNDQAEWQSGHNLADMVAHLRGAGGYSGFALFRYEYLFMGDDPLRAQEADALRQLLLG